MKSAENAAVESLVRGIAEHVAEASGLEMVLVEVGRAGGHMAVRLTIDRPGGVTLDDCAEFSRRVGAVLEVEDPIPVPYELEVSSPGLDRRLVRESDYQRFAGRRARISLDEPLEGQRNFQGVVKGIEGGEILLEIEGGRLVRLPYTRVDRARLVPEL